MHKYCIRSLRGGPLCSQIRWCWCNRISKCTNQIGSQMPCNECAAIIALEMIVMTTSPLSESVRDAVGSEKKEMHKTCCLLIQAQLAQTKTFTEGDFTQLNPDINWILMHSSNTIRFESEVSTPKTTPQKSEHLGRKINI